MSPSDTGGCRGVGGCGWVGGVGGGRRSDGQRGGWPSVVPAPCSAPLRSPPVPPPLCPPTMLEASRGVGKRFAARSLMMDTPGKASSAFRASSSAGSTAVWWRRRVGTRKQQRQAGWLAGTGGWRGTRFPRWLLLLLLLLLLLAKWRSHPPLMSFSNSRLMDSACARITGTRMQVPVMATSESPQILRVSLTCRCGARGGGRQRWRPGATPPGVRSAPAGVACVAHAPGCLSMLGTSCTAALRSRCCTIHLLHSASAAQPPAATPTCYPPPPPPPPPPPTSFISSSL